MSDFRIKTEVLGIVSTNCYMMYQEQTREAVIVDPADNAPYILNRCRELKVTPVAVFLTHGHFDHMLAAEEIRRAFRVEIYAGEGEDQLLKSPTLNLSWQHGGTEGVTHATVLLKDGQELDLMGYHWKVIATPGHTAGSVCYYNEAEGVLISGDTLFLESLGRTDLPTSSPSAIVKSITEKLFPLPEDVMVYPGHGDPTTIGHERQYNPAAAYYNRGK